MVGVPYSAYTRIKIDFSPVGSSVRSSNFLIVSIRAFRNVDASIGLVAKSVFDQRKHRKERETVSSFMLLSRYKGLGHPQRSYTSCPQHTSLTVREEVWFRQGFRGRGLEAESWVLTMTLFEKTKVALIG